MRKKHLNSPDWDPDLCDALIRRHAHDVRNGLNGFAMEASLLEAIHGDQRTSECLRRMRRQLGEIELAQSFLMTRFLQPDVKLVPVWDVFTRWQSLSRKLSQFEVTKWGCHVTGDLISVDARMVSDALTEGLRYAKGPVIEASVRLEGTEIIFEIRETSESPDTTRARVSEWPMLDQVMVRNGGRYEVAIGEGSVTARKCWFPAC